MERKLYKLAIWYIRKCNAKWDKGHKRELKQLDRLTYRNCGDIGKAYLSYGCDAEWQNFSRYDVLNNAIQKLADYEDAVERGLLLKLPKGVEDIDKRVIEYSLVKAINLSRYGVDVDDKLKNATETAWALNQSYMRGRQDEKDKTYEFKEEWKQEIRNKAIDEFVSRLEKHEQENWVDHQEYGITWSDIELIAEQMKEE